ncbi:hypothetical protein [Streptomyces sp. CC224B]|uniref:hypothetical protein n=1 Tax=Streptomyces sp. CC224B TaxID=3044571 RepID=UPI0024A7D668|nr:hypothetical protein [Streptomyces sp. CC224B]
MSNPARNQEPEPVRPAATRAMREQLAPERLDEIRAMRFTTGLTPVPGRFATAGERELYVQAARHWNALQDLLRDHEHLTAAHAEASARLAEWEGALT